MSAKEIGEILKINADAMRLEREKLVTRLQALTRKDVSHSYDVESSKDGRFVEWDDVQKIIEELSA